MGAKRESLKIVPPGKMKCIWMEAGVVSYKLCDNNYDCSTCSYDHAMDAKITKEKIAADVSATMSESWIEMMMKLPATQRKCRYMLTGEIGRKLCANAYACGSCSFDQMMQERFQAEPLPVQASTKEAGFEMAEGFYYHEGHTWARPEYGGRIRVGFDDFAQKLFGKKGRIELPAIGQKVKQGEAGFVVKRNGQTVQILTPVEGVVTHINKELLNQPELVNESPYDKGWLFTIEPVSLRKNLKSLYFGEDAHRYFGEERDRLFSMANQDLHVAADGGESIEDIFEEMEGDDWAGFARTFFKT
jgi:glycine cleavage system H lipoate-binding protein